MCISKNVDHIDQIFMMPGDLPAIRCCGAGRIRPDRMGWMAA